MRVSGSADAMPDGAAARRVVAIDGPSGSGKSTVAQRVGEALELRVLDTGSMYRALTWAVLRHGADPADATEVASVGRRVHFEVGPPSMVDGLDVTEVLRSPEVTASVSLVASHAVVRALLVERQQAWIAERGGGVVEGRDIGTVVAPSAALKVYLVAAERERAIRRLLQEGRRPEELSPVLDAIRRRDDFDQGRAVDPLKPAPDAVVVDTTARSVDEIVTEIVVLYRRAVAEEAP